MYKSNHFWSGVEVGGKPYENYPGDSLQEFITYTGNKWESCKVCCWCWICTIKVQKLRLSKNYCSFIFRRWGWVFKGWNRCSWHRAIKPLGIKTKQTKINSCFAESSDKSSSPLYGGNNVERSLLVLDVWHVFNFKLVLNSNIGLCWGFFPLWIGNTLITSTFCHVEFINFNVAYWDYCVIDKHKVEHIVDQ